MLSLALAALLASTPAAAAPPAPYVVVRPGDSTLSCTALLAEINALNAETAARQQAATAKISGAGMRSGGATVSTAVGMLTGMLPFGGGLIQSAVTDAQNAATMQQIRSASASLTADLPVYNRIQHLEELSTRKGC